MNLSFLSTPTTDIIYYRGYINSGCFYSKIKFPNDTLL